jgi:hypothetical protein
MPGVWQRYYTMWKEATREHLGSALLELLPPLAKLTPPAAVMIKPAILRLQSLIC